MKTANKNQFLTVAKATNKKIKSFQLSFISQPLAVFTLVETDDSSETGYPLDNSRQVIRLNSKMERSQFRFENPPDFMHLFFRQF